VVEGGGCSRLRAQASLAKIDTRWLQIQYAKRRREATGDESWLRAIGVDQRLGGREEFGGSSGGDDGKPFTVVQHVSGRGRRNKVRWELGRHQDCAGYD
jgi:hypothetical protein